MITSILWNLIEGSISLPLEAFYIHCVQRKVQFQSILLLCPDKSCLRKEEKAANTKKVMKIKEGNNNKCVENEYLCCKNNYN